MSKIAPMATIESCWQCKHQGVRRGANAKRWCRLKRYKEIDLRCDDFPDWCPLEDYVKEGRK